MITSQLSDHPVPQVETPASDQSIKIRVTKVNESDEQTAQREIDVLEWLREFGKKTKQAARIVDLGIQSRP